MNCLVLCEDSTGNKIEFDDKCINEINFGEVGAIVQTYREYSREDFLSSLPFFLITDWFKIPDSDEKSETLK